MSEAPQHGNGFRLDCRIGRRPISAILQHWWSRPSAVVPVCPLPGAAQQQVLVSAYARFRKRDKVQGRPTSKRSCLLWAHRRSLRLARSVRGLVSPEVPAIRRPGVLHGLRVSGPSVTPLSRNGAGRTVAASRPQITVLDSPINSDKLTVQTSTVTCLTTLTAAAMPLQF